MFDPFRNHQKDECPQRFDYPKPSTHNLSCYSSLEAELPY